MGYSAIWKVLEQMMIDLRKKGASVRPEIMDDLKNAKTLIKILMVEPSRGENIQKVEQYLGNVESYLVSEGQRTMGLKYVDDWLERLEKANREIFDEEEAGSRFVSGVPRHEKWIRVTSSNDLSIEKLKAAANEMKLSYSEQKEGSLLVHGGDQSIKDFVKKMASKHGAKAEKYRKKVHNC